MAAAAAAVAVTLWTGWLTVSSADCKPGIEYTRYSVYTTVVVCCVYGSVGMWVNCHCNSDVIQTLYKCCQVSHS